MHSRYNVSLKTFLLLIFIEFISASLLAAPLKSFIPFSVISHDEELRSSTILNIEDQSYAISTSYGKVTHQIEREVYLFNENKKNDRRISAKLIINDRIRNFSVWKLSEKVNVDLKKFHFIDNEEEYNDLGNKNQDVDFWGILNATSENISQIQGAQIQFLKFKDRKLSWPGFEDSLIFTNAQAGFEGSAITIENKKVDKDLKVNILAVVLGFIGHYNYEYNVVNFSQRGVAVPLFALIKAVKNSLTQVNQNNSKLSSGCFHADEIIKDESVISLSFSDKKIFCWDESIDLDLENSLLTFKSQENEFKFRIFDINSPNKVDHHVVALKQEMMKKIYNSNYMENNRLKTNNSSGSGGPDTSGADSGSLLFPSTYKLNPSHAPHSALFIDNHRVVTYLKYQPTILGKNRIGLQADELFFEGEYTIPVLMRISYNFNIPPIFERRTFELDSIYNFIEFLQFLIIAHKNWQSKDITIESSIYSFLSQQETNEEFSLFNKINTLFWALYNKFNKVINMDPHLLINEKGESGNSCLNRDVEKVHEILLLIANTLDSLPADHLKKISEYRFSIFQLNKEDKNWKSVIKGNASIFQWIDGENNIKAEWDSTKKEIIFWLMNEDFCKKDKERIKKIKINPPTFGLFIKNNI